MPLLSSPGAGRSLVDREAGLSRVGRCSLVGLAGSVERTIIPPARAGGGSKLRGRRFGLLAARIVPSEALLSSDWPEGFERARGLLFRWFAEGGNRQRNSLERGLRPPLRGLISAQVRPWRWRCGTKSRFFVHGAWPAPRGVRSVVSAARYVGFPGPTYLTPLSLAERFLGDNNILCFRYFFAQIMFCTDSTDSVLSLYRTLTG